MARRKSLGAEYQSLSGDQLLDQLVRDDKHDILEALWRLREPAVCARVASRLALARVPPLADLLVEEALSPSMGESVAPQLLESIRKHRPPMSRELAARLSERLRDPSPLLGSYESNRGLLQSWVIEQDAPDSVDFAYSVIAGELPGAETVLEAAYSRCQQEPALLKRCANTLQKKLQEGSSEESWNAAANFLRGVTVLEAWDPALRPLLTELIERAPHLARSNPVSADLVRIFGVHGSSVVKQVIEGPQLPQTPGSFAVIGALEEMPKDSERSRAWVQAILHQPHLWPQVSQGLSALEPEEWERRLRAVARLPAETQIPVLGDLLTMAPEASMRRIVQVALKFGSENVLQVAGSRLRAAAEAKVGAEGEAPIVPWLVKTLHWPKEKDEEALERLDQVLIGALTPERRRSLAVAALEAGVTTPKQAARLVPSNQVLDALREATPGLVRIELTRELARYEDEGELEGAVRTLQAESFSLDLAAGYASTKPHVAFVRAHEAYSALQDDEQDELLALVEAHGTTDTIPLLDAILRETHRRNDQRRMRAAKRVSALLSPGDSLPEGVAGLLESSRPELRATGAEVIANIRPRDPDLCRRLRGIQGAGVAAKSARKAREALAQEYLDELDQDPSREQRADLLRLLGAVAVAEMIDPLLDHLGARAIDDDPRIRRTAAEALREASTYVVFTPEQQARLVTLLEGEDQEADELARDHLSSALARVILGPDAALQILYDLIGFDPKVDPTRLYGAEKDSLVRHLALYSTARERGESGYAEQIAQLDIIAERLVRASYLHYGTSDSLKDEIRAGPSTPGYGELIQAMASAPKIQGAQSALRMLHELRNRKTELTHAGEQPDSDDVTTANTCFVTAGKTLVGALKAAAR